MGLEVGLEHHCAADVAGGRLGGAGEALVEALVLAQRAPLHEGQAARAARVLAHPDVVFVVQLDDVVVGGEGHVTQLEREE